MAEKLKNRTLGYYNFRDRPTIIFPHLTGNKYQVVTELHEHVHLQLSISTQFGFFQRIIAILHEQAENNKADRDFFTNVQSSLMKACFNVHEGAATYQALMCRIESQIDLKEAYKRLPMSYKNAVGIFERILTPITNKVKTNIEDVKICDWIARTALNGPILNKISSPDQLTNLESFLFNESPDRRLAIIVAKLKDSSLLDGWRTKIREFLKTFKPSSDDYKEFMKKMHNFSKETTYFLTEDFMRYEPKLIIFNEDKERMEISKEFFLNWQSYYKRSNSFFLKDIKYEQMSSEFKLHDTEKTISSDIRIGNKVLDTLKDHTLLLNYREIKQEQARDLIEYHNGYSDQLLIISVIINYHETHSFFTHSGHKIKQGEGYFMIFQVPIREDARSDHQPFSFIAKKNDINQAIDLFKQCNVAWKVDERLLPVINDDSHVFLDIMVPLFTISKNEEFPSLCERIEWFKKFAKKTIILLKTLQNDSADSASTGICIITSHKFKKLFMYRITPLNWDFLKRKYSADQHIVFLDGESENNHQEYKEILDKLKLREAVLYVPYFTYI